MSLRINSVVPLLQVRDLAQTIDFYTTHLGFEVEATYPQDAPPAWCMLRSGGAVLMFSVFAELEAPQVDGVLYFYPDSVAEAWERLRGVAEVVEPMAVMDWGQREFSIRDPNGFILSFGEHTDDPPDHQHPHGEDDHEHGDHTH